MQFHRRLSLAILSAELCAGGFRHLCRQLIVSPMSTLSRLLMKRLGYRLPGVSFTVLAALVTAGCGSHAAATGAPSLEKTNLTIATVPTASSAGLYVAQRDGFFRQAGLNVRIVNVGSGAGVTTGLLNGSIDVLDGDYAEFIQAQVRGAGRFHI